MAQHACKPRVAKIFESGIAYDIMQSNGRQVPDGGFYFTDVPDIRLSHCQGQWTINTETELYPSLDGQAKLIRIAQ